MPDSGKYIEIAGGNITERYEQDYEMYAGGNINIEAAKSVNQTGAEKGVSFNVAKMPRPGENQEKQENDESQDHYIMI